ncbi:MAG: DUF2752 domain-containing protein [Myxococcales bacterium]
MTGVAALALLLTARFVPIARYWPYWGCPLRKATGLPCLSCGMTRSFDWFMRGRWLDALLVNPLGFTLALLASVAALYLLLAPLRPPRPVLTLPHPLPLPARLGIVAALAATLGGRRGRKNRIYPPQRTWSHSLLAAPPKSGRPAL